MQSSQDQLLSASEKEDAENDTTTTTTRPERLPMHAPQHSNSMHNTSRLIHPVQIQGRASSMASHYSASYYTISHDNEFYTQVPLIALYGVGSMTSSQDAEFSGDASTSGVSSAAAQPPPPINRPLWMATLTTATLQFLVGYHLVLLNAIEPYAFRGHATWEWSWAVAALAIGAPLGCIGGGYGAQHYGRKLILGINALFFLVGELLQLYATGVAASSLEIFIVGRAMMGVASGVATVLVPIYLGELAPPQLRGTLGTINQFSMVVGILVADLLSFGFATPQGWKHLVLFPIGLSIFQLCVLPWVVESPVWKIQQAPDSFEARAFFLQLRGKNANNMAQVEAELQQHIRMAQQQQQKAQCSSSSSSSRYSLRQQWHDFWNVGDGAAKRRYRLVAVILLHTVQQWSGISVLFYYSTQLFGASMERPLVGTTLMGTVNVACTYLALLYMDKFPRTTLLLYSIGGMIVAMLVLTVTQLPYLQEVYPLGTTIVLVLAVNAAVACYGLGLGPIPWILLVEYFEDDARHVSLVLSVISTYSWMVNFLLTLAFPVLLLQANGAAQPYTFALFGLLLMGAGTAIGMDYLPEPHPMYGSSTTVTPKPLEGHHHPPALVDNSNNTRRSRCQDDEEDLREYHHHFKEETNDPGVMA